jgi:predicted transglutaminase-like cysteine proteinase
MRFIEHLKGTWLVALAALAAPLPAAAVAIDPFLTPRHPIAAPYGFVAMCSAQPDACTDARVVATPATKRWEPLLRRINRRVNRHVLQVSDETRFAQHDLWQASGIGRGAEGDCEDIAIEKRKLLVDAGVPADRLFLAVAYGSRGVGLHLVLIARTDRGDVVLDSRSSSITPWSHTPYTWIAIQSTNRPGAWFSV